MAESLSHKKKIRADHRATLTRALGDIATALRSDTPERDTVASLKLTLNEKLETLTRLDSEILELTAEEGIEGEIQQSDECKEKIYEGLTVSTGYLILQPPQRLLLPQLQLPYLMIVMPRSNSQRLLYLTLTAT